MKRYTTSVRPSSDYDDWYSFEKTFTVFEQEPVIKKTGILDSKGDEIYSVEEMNRIGFVFFD